MAVLEGIMRAEVKASGPLIVPKTIDTLDPPPIEFDIIRERTLLRQDVPITDRITPVGIAILTIDINTRPLSLCASVSE